MKVFAKIIHEEYKLYFHWYFELVLIYGSLFWGYTLMYAVASSGTSGVTLQRDFGRDMLGYYIFIFSAALLSFNEMQPSITNKIQRGTIIYILTAPLNPLFYFIISSFSTLLVNITVFVPLAAILCAIGLVSLQGALFILACSLFIFLSAIGIAACVGSVTWFFPMHRSLYKIINNLIGLTAGAYIPLRLFPESVQTMFMAMPFKYMAAVPAELFIAIESGKSVSTLNFVSVAAGNVIIFAVFSAVAYAMFEAARRKGSYNV